MLTVSSIKPLKTEAMNYKYTKFQVRSKKTERKREGKLLTETLFSEIKLRLDMYAST